MLAPAHGGADCSVGWESTFPLLSNLRSSVCRLQHHVFVYIHPKTQINGHLLCLFLARFWSNTDEGAGFRDGFYLSQYTINNTGSPWVS